MAISEAIDKAQEENESIHSDSNSMLTPFKENLYEAFSSKFFVDECDYDTKLIAF